MRTGQNSIAGSIASMFHFEDPTHIGGIPFLQSKELSRQEVESITFDASTPEVVAKQFFHVLNVANKMILGEDDTFPGHRFHPDSICYVLYTDGLKLMF
jgi:hypothetical protein